MNIQSRPSRIDQIWIEQKNKLRIQFDQLTDEDFKFEVGRKLEMIERIRIKLGKTEEEMDNILNSL
jgi:hypothetical protein